MPVIDLFAGPGGLGEGFASTIVHGHPKYKLELSVECDLYAYQTLSLRAFCREFTGTDRPLPEDYYAHLRGEIGREELEAKHPREADSAKREACLARLGDHAGDTEIQRRLDNLRAKVDFHSSVIIGGPPCQAYSLVGRARLSRAKAAGDYRETEDGRHVLYKQYLKLLVELQPAAFVMENVRGILSSSYEGARIFPRIYRDLESAGYDLHPLGAARTASLFGDDDPAAFLLTASDFGVPQRRSRVFIIGTRKDLKVRGFGKGLARRDHRTVGQTIGDLPRLRSGLSSGDSSEAWYQTIQVSAKRLVDMLPKGKSRNGIRALLKQLGQSGVNLPSQRSYQFARTPARGSKGLVLNHETRSHIPEDLCRYLFCAAWSVDRSRSPMLADFPDGILPNHKNVKAAMDEGGIEQVAFGDRFRVQLKQAPSNTITSHISKDGHGFIHYDPYQCRSLTVREAARLQTFPDNYFFCGPRTEQYRQVGNAVPPELAKHIADLLLRVLSKRRR